MPKKRRRIIISGAVEGTVDEVVLRTLIRRAGAEPGSIYGRHGKQYLRKNLMAYNRAAGILPWVVLVDLDHDAACAVAMRRKWLMELAPMMCFRVAVREIESWILADRERLAEFLRVPRRLIPEDPESLDDPKGTFIFLAKHSRRRRLRREMVPRKDSWRDVGPGYNSRLIQFVIDQRRGWRPEVAAQHSESLRRAMACVSQLVRQADGAARRRPK